MFTIIAEILLFSSRGDCPSLHVISGAWHGGGAGVGDINRSNCSFTTSSNDSNLFYIDV